MTPISRRKAEVLHILTASPPGHKYAEELQRRFGAEPQLLRMCDSMGSGEKRRPYELAEGIAIIDISGVLVNEPWYYDETGYADIGDEVTMALDDHEVKGILLRINSPGGETDGAYECAALLAKAAKKKPMWAAADVMAYSAAYLLASQTTKIYAPAISGGVGSIGVYAMHANYAGMLKQNGIEITFISAGEGKTDGNPYQPLSKEALTTLQAEVNRLYGEFVAYVSRGRKMTKEAVRALGAYCYDGAKAAMGAGLADAAGSLEQAWMEMATSVASTNSPAFAGRQVSALQAEEVTALAEDLIPKQEVAMATENAAGTSAEKQFTQADLDRLVAEATTKAKGEGRAESNVELTALKDAEEIRALGQMSRQPALASKFIADKKSVAEFRTALNALAVETDATEINNHRKPAPAEPEQAAAVTGAMLLAAVDKLVAQSGGAK